MKIILLKDIPKIGRKNEVKEIADGYALNFVLPRGLGIKATPGEIAKLDKVKATEDAEKQIQDNLLKKSLEQVSAMTITIQEKTNEKGHLFEGIGRDRLVKEIEKALDIKFEPSFIELAKPLKEVGQFIVDINAHGKKGKVKVVIEGK